jgi:hypothetical protein
MRFAKVGRTLSRQFAAPIFAFVSKNLAVGNSHEDAKATYNRALAVLDEETRDGVSGSKRVVTNVSAEHVPPASASG